jgi:hypothetical protein
MEDFIKRTRASFGSLCQKPPTHVVSDSGHPQSQEEELVSIGEWVPSTEPVFRDDNMNDTSDDEEEERLRRTSPGGMSLVLEDEEELDAAVGMRPSIAFSSQIDREEEMDIIDLQSLQFEDRNGMDEETSRYVVEEGDNEDVDGQSSPGALSRQEQYIVHGLRGHHHHGNHHHGNGNGAESRRVLTQGLRSVLKKSSGGGGGKKHGKRVSFTGLPEPKRPYVPPFKRGTGSNNNKGKQSVEEQPQVNVPDHVKNPGRYTRYEFDEPVVVGGGFDKFSQSTSSNNNNDTTIVSLDDNSNDSNDDARY